MTRRRPWLSGLKTTSKTAIATFGMLRSHRLGPFVPFVGFLLLGAVLLWVINAIAPLAPFVYSLF